MIDLRKLIFGGAERTLSPELAAAVQAWQELPAPEMQLPHYHTRYVVLDIAMQRPGDSASALRGVGAIAVTRGSTLAPHDAFLLKPAGTDNDPRAVDTDWAAFLAYVGKSPVVTFHAPFVVGTLARELKAQLGVDFDPPVVDLAWTLPALFSDRSASVVSLDQWLSLFDTVTEGRRDLMENTLQLARLLQRVLVRASAMQIDTPDRLVEESEASRTLRQAA